MLSTLRIKNIVLIDSLVIEFHTGLSALTGETGAGKSILLDSLGLALGARADSGLVRKGEDKASVTAAFDLPAGHPVFQLLSDNEIDAQAETPIATPIATQGELIIRRVLSADGKSKAFVNDQPVSASLLKQIGAMLVEIHGQFDTQSLLNPKTHLSLLDSYAGHGDLLMTVRDQWASWRAALKQAEDERAAMDRARSDESYYRQSLEDLDALAPKEGEEETLTALRNQLKRRSQIIENVRTVEGGLQEIESLSGSVFRAAEKIGEGADALIATLDRVNAEIQEAFSNVNDISYSLDHADYSLEEIEDRLYALKNQAHKHHCTIDALPEKREEIAAALNAIETQDDRLAAFIRAADNAEKDYLTAADSLSRSRQAAAQTMQDLVMAELPPLKLEKARFSVVVEPTDPGPQGTDQGQFLVATNPGASMGPLNKIASGGEMARFMLALKVVLSGVGHAHTLVFDELDSGVGGATAAAIGERLSRLAQTKQVLAVTHSPQVAATASSHWIVRKGGDTVTKTEIIPLTQLEARREEIARMLAGAEITEEARAAAGKLLESA